MSNASTHPLGRRRLLAPATALAAALLLLAGCGDDDTGGLDQAIEDLPTDVPDEETAPDELDDPAGEGLAEPELQPLRIMLPEPTDPPAGFRAIPPVCEADEGGVWFTFAVPEGWDATGRSFGGSGSPLGDSIDLRFDTGDGDVTVATDPDSRRPDGTILNGAGEEWESFDYDYTRGEESGRITYDEVATASVGDQDVAVVVAEQDQAPEMLGATEYKARLELAELPNPAPGDDDGITPASMVVTISFDAEELELAADEVVEILSTFAAPECTVDRIVAGREILLGEDVNGDGEVSTVDDLRS